jgi:endonuclease/exonuclease/phosphatase family metal-dependent hydrolase
LAVGRSRPYGLGALARSGLVAALIAQGCVSAERDQHTAADTAIVSTTATARASGRPPGSLRILAYNIRHGEGVDSTINLKRVARLIRELDPDVVALQEIDSAVERSYVVDQATVLGQLAGMSAVFGSFFDYGGGRYGMAILSRHPILAHENHRLPDGLEPRTALAARLRPWPDGPEITVVGVHLYATADERQAQAARIIELYGDSATPVVLAGDFNSTPDSEVLDSLRAHFTVPAKGEERFTFPAPAPEREIDFIMYRPAARFRVLSHQVVNEPLISDHRPVLLDVTIE